MKGRAVEQERGVDKDPVLGMPGVGKQLWEEESGDTFVDRLRSQAPVGLKEI
jgi:hypothetical protein